MKAWSLNHRTAREFLHVGDFKWLKVKMNYKQASPSPFPKVQTSPHSTLPGSTLGTSLRLLSHHLLVAMVFFTFKHRSSLQSLGRKGLGNWWRKEHLNFQSSPISQTRLLSYPWVVRRVPCCYPVREWRTCSTALFPPAAPRDIFPLFL